MKSQSLSFTFDSYSTQYSCWTLRSKVQQILEGIDPASRFEVEPRSCSDRYDVSMRPNVEIRVSAPVEATAAEVAAMQSSRSKRELVARIRGDLAQAREEEQQFPAYWRRVEVTRRDIKVDPEDCELIEALKRQVLPKLAIRLAKDDVRCRVGDVSLHHPKLIVEVLTAVPTPDDPAANLDEHSERR